MNTFECRSCKNQFQNRAPICPSGASHTVVLRRAAQPRSLPARNNLATNTPTVKTEGPAADAPLGPGDWTKRDRENCTQRWKDACLYNLRANNFRRYTLVCDNRTIAGAARDLGLPEPLRTQWISHERRLWP